jgi:hypothetical protein
VDGKCVERESKKFKVFPHPPRSGDWVKTFIQSSHFLGFAGNISKRKAFLNRPRFAQYISMPKQDNVRNSFVHQQASFYR